MMGFGARLSKYSKPGRTYRTLFYYATFMARMAEFSTHQHLQRRMDFYAFDR
jgi:hypothetical protein